MNSLSDQQLLRSYAQHRAEAAFTELVRRHVDLVYSAALRMVRDAHLAEDVTQSAFVALAQNAGQLSDRPVLSGWLHRTAQNLASKSVRSEVRRRAREQEVVAMNALLSTEADATWEHIAPQLDAALGELSDPDRDALFLRYFEGKSARDMAQTLGTTEDAAQRRVSRAVERLREFFAKRGVTVGASHLCQRRPGRARRIGRHDFRRRRFSRHDLRDRRNRHQSHRHDHPAKDSRQRRNRRRHQHWRLRSPPSFNLTSPSDEAFLTVSTEGKRASEGRFRLKKINDEWKIDPRRFDPATQQYK